MAATVPPAISVEHVSASYRLRKDIRIGKTSWRAGLSHLMSGGGTVRLVPALRDVSLTVPRGTVLGVIGRNGAGKSTLLRTIAGILPPAEGRIVVRGQVSALLAAGFGFNRALSGRANIELGALAMGFSEQRVDEVSESIAEFAQLGEYIDLPMQAYSSGMRSRLGFSLAAHLDPQILLIDEALAGGDSKFKQRVEKKMVELCNSGRTIVLVSHALQIIKEMTSACLWLHQGKVAEHGDTDEVVSSYMRFCGIEEALDDD
jgi:ABC-type polysaccharide/polyol phosphate transport system ATPase subunit